MSTLIVFSHLRWFFVRRRPQHLMTQLAAHFNVVYVEEPVYSDTAAHWVEHHEQPNLHVLVPHTPVRAAGFHHQQLTLLRPMLEAWLREHGASDVVVWLYTPMALPMVRPLRPRMVVYDCVDDLSTPQHAAQPLPQSELALLRAADLVITSGPSMYEAKRGLHPNVHYLPSAVDAAHFAPPPPDADDPEAAVAARLLAAAPRPRLGCFGVIDERLDLGLIDAVALARPDWHLVMVGPVCARYEAVLPRRPNIHWLGRQPYERLPHLMTAWDVCLMPYALGASARHLSPIKTLEYMAGEKPVVSTAVPDVVSLYGDLVRIARGPSGFIDACAAALAETPHQRSERLGRAVTTLFRSSWQQHGQFVHALIAAHLRQSTPTMLSALGAGMLQIAPSLATPAA